MPARLSNLLKRWMEKGASLFPRSRDLSESAMERLSELPGISTSLETVCLEAEPRFVDLGERLQTIYSDASTLSGQTLRAAGLMTGESEEGVPAKVEKYARASLGELKSCRTDVADNLECVDAVVRHLGSLYSMTDVIEKIARYLRIVGLNIGVECSRSAESREMFEVVALDTKKLSEKIIEIVAGIRDHAESARASQISAREAISGGVNHLAGLTQGAEENVKEAVEDIGRLMEISLRAFRIASDHSRKISDQVGEIVVGIQFHDNMSQRIDHIGASIRRVMELCEKDGSDPAEFSRDRILASAHSIVMLQAAQLGHVIDDLRGVYRKNMGAFEEIINEVENLASSLAAFGAGGGEAGGPGEEEPGDDSLAALESALGSLHELLARGRELFDRMRESAGHASETTARLSASADQVRGISMETHVMALNAIVKAAHLGERGLALEVLAQEVKKLSDRSGEFTADVNKLLEAISGSSLRLKERSRAAGDGDGSEIGAASLENGIEDISSAYAKFREDSSEVSRRAESLTDRISETRSGLEFLPALAEELTGLLSRLEEIAHELSPWAGRAGDDLESETGRLADKYTMDQERLIHGRLIPGALESDAAPGSDRRRIDPGDAGDVMLFDTPGDDLGDVELFDAPADENAASGDDLGNVEFFDAPADKSAASGDDFGNVEFFDAPVDESAASGDDLGSVELFDAPADENAASGDDLGNVEFFDSPASGSAEPDDDLGNVELFDAPADEEAAPGDDPGDGMAPIDSTAEAPDIGKDKKKKEEEEDFGDNVELF